MELTIFAVPFSSILFLTAKFAAFCDPGIDGAFWGGNGMVAHGQVQMAHSRFLKIKVFDKRRWNGTLEPVPEDILILPSTEAWSRLPGRIWHSSMKGAPKQPSAYLPGMDMYADEFESIDECQLTSDRSAQRHQVSQTHHIDLRRKRRRVFPPPDHAFGRSNMECRRSRRRDECRGQLAHSAPSIGVFRCRAHLRPSLQTSARPGLFAGDSFELATPRLKRRVAPCRGVP